MASYTILKNTSLLIDLPSDIADQGWEVSGNIAYHSGCNSGYIDEVFDLSSAEEWTFRYKILSLTSGSINIVVDGEVGVSRTEAGTYEETFEVTGSKLVRFFSTGINSIEFLKVFKTSEESNAVTLAFNEGADKWTTKYGYHPEFMCKFINDFFAFKDGQLWEQNVNPLRNNFFGQQSYTEIKFICNMEYFKNKLFFNLRLDGRGQWFSPSLKTNITNQFPNGMESRLSPSNFKLIDGVLWADILRDFTDPRFNTIVDPDQREVQALFNGRMMQGNYMEITLRSNGSGEGKLISCEVYVNDAERNL